MEEGRVMGPVDYLVVEFPGNRMTGQGLLALIDLVEAGIIRILDLSFVRRDEDGSVMAMEIADFDGDDQLDLAVFEGAASGLLDEDDLASAGDVLQPGSSPASSSTRTSGQAPSSPAFAPAGRNWSPMAGSPRPT